MRRLAFVSLLAVLAAGCGEVKTGGAGTGPGGTPTPGGTSTPAPTPTPDGGGYDPGPVPTTLGGMAAFTRIREHDVGDVVGIDDFDGMVNFFPIPVPVPPTLADVWNDFPGLAMDACEVVYPSSVGLSTNIDPPNAGVLSLVGPTGQTAMTLNMLAGFGMYFSALNPPEGFVPDSEYTLKATGGSIGAFEHKLESPGEITAMTPDITTTIPFPIDRTQPLHLEWNSVPDGRPIYLFLSQQDQVDYPEAIWMCKLADDGSFDVPLEMLQSFGPTVTPFPTETWRDKLALRRWKYGSFTPPNAVGPVITAMESGWYADVQFQ